MKNNYLTGLVLAGLVLAACNNSNTQTDTGTSATDPSMSKESDTTMKLHKDSTTVDSISRTTDSNGRTSKK